MSFHDDKEGVPISTGVAIRIGSFIIKAFFEFFKDQLREPNKFLEKINVMLEIVNKARIEVLNFDTKGRPQFGDIKAIYGKEESAIDEMFVKLKLKYK